MSALSEKHTRSAVGLAFAGLTVFLGYFVRRPDFLPLIVAYAAFFGLYVWLLFFKKNGPAAEIRFYVGLGIGLRVLLLFSVPNLSDDFYRFLWDGHLTLAGIHPFAHPPVYYFENRIFPPGITPGLYARLNSPEYFTVYPPVCQAAFALAAWVGGTSIWGGVVVLKLFLLACELGTIRILGQSTIRNPKSPIPNPQVLYALNPLVILEISGNCHFEGAMIFFLLAGVWALGRNRIRLSALWWALATASKLLPLMFLPLVWRRLGWRQGSIFTAVFAGASLVLFAPLLSVLPNMFSSLDLYFRQFQFNASVYHLLRAVGLWIKGYDIGETLGPFLGLVTVAAVLWIAWRSPAAAGQPDETPVAGTNRAESAAHPSGKWPRANWQEALLLALMLQLTFAATVHPWYATVPFAMGLLTRWRFPVWWTGLIGLSYSHYAGGLFQENYWLIALEYSVLWAFIYFECQPFIIRHPDSAIPNP